MYINNRSILKVTNYTQRIYMINKIIGTQSLFKKMKAFVKVQTRVSKDYAVHLDRYYNEKYKCRNYHVSLYAFLSQILNNPVQSTVLVSPLDPDMADGQELVWIDVRGYAKYDIPVECFILPGGDRGVLNNFE